MSTLLGPNKSYKQTPETTNFSKKMQLYHRTELKNIYKNTSISNSQQGKTKMSHIQSKIIRHAKTQEDITYKKEIN